MRQIGRNIAVSSRFGLSRPSRLGFGLAPFRVTDLSRYFFFAALLAGALAAAGALRRVGGPGCTDSPNRRQRPSTA